MKRAAGVMALGLLLVGCGSDDPPTPDQVFTQYLVDEGIATNQEGAESYLAVAERICSAHDSGASTLDIIDTLLQSADGLSGYQVGQLHGAAVASYCPEYGER